MTEWPLESVVQIVLSLEPAEMLKTDSPRVKSNDLHQSPFFSNRKSSSFQKNRHDPLCLGCSQSIIANLRRGVLVLIFWLSLAGTLPFA
jgi:hypothetical protein